MTKRTKRWMRTRSKGVINRSLWRWMVLVAVGVMAVLCCVHAVLASANHGKVSMHPAQEVAIAAEADFMMGRIDDMFAFSTGWEDQEAKDKLISYFKRSSEGTEILACKFGPVEIPQGETVDTATRVAIPVPSMTDRTRATGKIWESKRVPNADNGAFVVLEKRETLGGPKWCSMDVSPGGGPGLREWLRLPRKKVADSPTIVMKKAVVVQILDANDTVTDQKIIYFDK
ncbi:MAG: hypothetical protein JW993_19640 [Sedimentisphaerales bacterium]|nr:hypothetical protein [Sedimentisphaerales bacterium]